MAVYFPLRPYIFGPKPYIVRQDRIFYQDRIFSRTVHFTDHMIILNEFYEGVDLCGYIDVGDSFDHFGHQHTLSFYTSLGHPHSKDVTNIKIE